RLRQPRVDRVLETTHPRQGLGTAAARLRQAHERALPHRVFHPRFRRRPRLPHRQGRGRVVGHGRRQDAADDLGVPRRTHRHRQPRVCGLGEQRAVGHRAHHGSDSVSRIALPHGRESQWTFPHRAFVRRLGHAVAAGPLSEDFRRHLVHVAGPQRLPRFHRARPVRAERECLHPARRHLVPAGAHEGQGHRHVQAVRATRARARAVRRPDGFVRLGVLAARAGWTSGADVRPQHRQGESGNRRVLARSLRHRASNPNAMATTETRSRRQDPRDRRHRRHVLSRWRRAQAEGRAGQGRCACRGAVPARQDPRRSLLERQGPRLAGEADRVGDVPRGAAGREGSGGVPWRIAPDHRRRGNVGALKPRDVPQCRALIAGRGRSMRTRWLLALLLAFFVAPSFAATPPNSAPSQPLRDLDSYVQRTMHDWHVPGLAIVVVKDGKVLAARGYGVRELGKPGKVDADTLFDIGSNSKAFTVAALGTLVSSGKLKWDAPVVDELKGFKLESPYVTQNVTLRDLLTHRTGYCDPGAAWYTSDAGDCIKRMRWQKPEFGFRTTFCYNNVQYLAASHFIPAITGQSWN